MCSYVPIIFVMQIKIFRGLFFSRKRITNALIRLRGCAGWFAPFVFACNEVRFSRDVTQIGHNNARRCPFEYYAVNEYPFERADRDLEKSLTRATAHKIVNGLGEQ